MEIFNMKLIALNLHNILEKMSATLPLCWFPWNDTFLFFPWVVCCFNSQDSNCVIGASWFRSFNLHLRVNQNFLCFEESWRRSRFRLPTRNWVRRLLAQFHSRYVFHESPRSVCRPQLLNLLLSRCVLKTFV